jgi:glycosyltransferase involved in cell wall biosynthesis
MTSGAGEPSLSASAVIPVKDGERYLEELLEALAREGMAEVLVIDSGSRDRSREVARAMGAELVEIEPEEFGHGRTRNLGAERTSGELICFLTQDATPVAGWLAAYRAAFALDERAGAAYGPHLARPDTSPMIARELESFFASFSPGGEPVVQRAGDPTFLSNVNACYLRSCWEEVRFRELAYSEDQAFGADMLAAGWSKVYHPGAGVLHAHDYGPVEFMRRYFDEYRGLRESQGHIESFALGALLRHVVRETAADRRWLAERGAGPLEQARWTSRASAHHTGRRVFSALGSRAERIPAPLRVRLSLEGRAGASTGRPQGPVDGAEAAGGAAREGGGAPPAAAPVPPTVPVWGARRREDYTEVVRVWREGPEPLLAPVPGMSERERLRIAMVIPPFRRGSGGHNTLLQILTRLEQRGHTCSLWLHDFTDQHLAEWNAVLRENVRTFFAPLRGPVYKGFEAWQGADVAIATGWQTVAPTLLLDNVRERAYLVNDHEPEFYSTSTDFLLAQDSYRYGLHCIAASPWLRDLLIERYAVSADAFQLGVEHRIYQPRGIPRRDDMIVYYARHTTPRRAVQVGMMALHELRRRHPAVRVVLFGDLNMIMSSFDYEHLSLLSPEQLCTLYCQATVGLCLSLTNFSLMPKEMLACGLPCVELAGISAESIFGPDGPLELAPLEPVAIADALERLLMSPELRERRSLEGIELVASHTWERATDEVEAGLRHALREREQASMAHASSA